MNSLTLGEVLQAKQVIHRVLKTHTWSSNENVVRCAPCISNLVSEEMGSNGSGNDNGSNSGSGNGSGIGVDDGIVGALRNIHEEIPGSVVIRKGFRSYNDPTGKKVGSHWLCQHHVFVFYSLGYCE